MDSAVMMVRGGHTPRLAFERSRTSTTFWCRNHAILRRMLGSQVDGKQTEQAGYIKAGASAKISNLVEIALPHLRWVPASSLTKWRYLVCLCLAHGPASAFGPHGPATSLMASSSSVKEASSSSSEPSDELDDTASASISGT